jgi:hypothetical protein
MFAFNRSAFAVLAPLALLAAVVIYSNLAPDPGRTMQADVGSVPADQTVAANLPSR